MIKMVVTDLDGTLLNNDQQVSVQNYQLLQTLQENSIVTVIATGRSPFSFRRVILADFPIDYLVFSSGAGIMNYRTGEIIYSQNLPGDQVLAIALKLHGMRQPFKVLAAVPDNHHYVYYDNGNLHSDFLRRMENYRGFEKPISFDPPNFGEACQFLIILPPDPPRFEYLKSQFEGVKVIRATSPIDHQSIWMEIYHEDVSKGKAIAWLGNRLKINKEEIVGVGNDYNDIDLLDYAGHSFVVSNAPEELKADYQVVSSNNESGFSEAVLSLPCSQLLLKSTK
ncbi:MAG: HAD family hydrolase [Bacteroidales bacterium]|nr:HAD family hydrolase [Bacteroidales bacterium]MDD3385353.1 HAD family hydrolase [Bacteroidales bacterium]MDD3870446.1 HAD family hydrolase [Bacteroidales bacterium]MDD4812538.1 HAD family hydrolase [Bacteroidales bacterium]